MITRIAPTPSGFLHEGNCVNFLLTAWLARQEGGTVALRIDDMDADRFRAEYVDDAFRVLQWLGIEWQLGPRSTDDFLAHHSLRARTEHYRAELDVLAGSPLTTYACGCSRSQAQAIGAMGCASDCREKGLALVPGHTALRVHIPEGTLVKVGEAMVDLHEQMGDFVVWRRDDRPAYQLASVIEDRELGTTHIVRGMDLLASSAAQIVLAQALGAQNVVDATYVHHGLLTDPDGRKLSKSQLSSGPLPEMPEVRSRVVAAAREFAGQAGIDAR